MDAGVKRVRLRAPELVGRGGWLNTGGAAPTLASLLGKIVLLDFWTFCCVNCLHVLDELRPIEAEFADVLVTIGIHSPKFEHETEHSAVVAAVGRYGVHHPVLDDPDLTTWSQYAVRAWPTLVVIDPEGYVVAQMSGEGHAHALRILIAELRAEHLAKGTLRLGGSPFVPTVASQQMLSFPSKVLPLPDGSLLVSDSAHHSLAHLGADGTTLIRRIGDGTRGWVDGTATTARFSEPIGMALLPPPTAQVVGYDVVIADSVNHCLRGLDTSTWLVSTIAGTGSQWLQSNPINGPATDIAMSTPWDVEWFEDAIVVATAGVHRLDRFDPRAGTLSTYAGTTTEGLVDGDLPKAWFAQPSGLIASSDDQTLWLVDAETSALRRLRNGVVMTEVGVGLFDFGHIDGPAANALLQHPLGLCELPDGSIAIADTFNGAIRRFDPQTCELTTLATGLAEPSDVCVVPDDDHGQVLMVVESAGHQLTRVVVGKQALKHRGFQYQTARPPTEVAPGSLTVEVVFTPPTGQKLDDRHGPSTHLVVSSSPAALLLDGDGPGSELVRQVVFGESTVEGVLHVSVRAASCDDSDTPHAAEFPACHVHSQDWGVPVRITAGGESKLTLMMAMQSGEEPEVS